MHSFKFIQKDITALDCELQLDGKPLYCDSFKLIAVGGKVSILEARILLKDVIVNVGELVLKSEQTTINELQTLLSELSEEDKYPEWSPMATRLYDAIYAGYAKRSVGV